MLLLGIGGTEWIVIGAAVLLFFGAKRIPEFAKGLGKGIREFKNAVNDVNQDVENSTKDVKKNIDSARDAGRIEMKD